MNIEDQKYSGYSKEKNLATIATFSGLLIAPCCLKPEDINLGDIIHALSNKCRFTGHSREFYSVAQHSVLVSKTAVKLLPKHSSKSVKNMVRAWGALHDGDEYCTPDLPTPLKVLPEYKFLKELGIEIRMMIMKKYGLPLEEPEEVQLADKIVLATEKRDLMNNPINGSWAVKLPDPLDKIIVPLSPKKAKRYFENYLKKLNCI